MTLHATRIVWRCFGLFLCVMGSLTPAVRSLIAAEPVSPIGRWKNEDADFEIFEQDGKLSAKIVALREPTTAEGKTKTDIHNPDPSKRTRPVIGMVFMTGFVKKNSSRWEKGTIYDPKSGNTYSCVMELQGADRIKVHGFIGISLIGRTQIWTRTN